MKQSNKILTVLPLQLLLSIGLFIGGCSSINETLPENNLPEEESLEVTTIRDLEVAIAVEERGETTTYDLKAFALRYPEKRQAMNSVLNRIVADPTTMRKKENCVFGCWYFW